MKTLCLPIIVVVTALSLASANAMPDLGRETGKFTRHEELAPKGVKTFEPAKGENSQPDVAILLPWHSASTESDLCLLLPWHRGGSKVV